MGTVHSTVTINQPMLNLSAPELGPTPGSQRPAEELNTFSVPTPYPSPPLTWEGRVGLQSEKKVLRGHLSPLPPHPEGSTGASRTKAPDSSHTAQPSRSTYCRKGPLRQQAPPLRPLGAKESTCRLPAAVRLPRTSCSLCNCARDPSRRVASAGTGTNNIGRTRSVALELQLPQLAALPAASSAAILVRPFLPVT